MESISLLQRLPTELRLSIYALSAENATIRCLTTGVQFTNADIMRTCRQVRTESEGVFYRLYSMHPVSFILEGLRQEQLRPHGEQEQVISLTTLSFSTACACRVR
jgi:hypothetical protein